jgi:hypothetical protein
VGIRTPGKSFGPYNGLANCLFHRPVVRIQWLMSGSEVAVRDKVLLFVISWATNCATHDQQRLTICRRFGAHNRRCPFSILFTNFQDLFERFLGMDAARSFSTLGLRTASLRQELERS